MDGRPIASVDDIHRILTEEKIGVATPLAVLRRAGRAEIIVVPCELGGGGQEN
jgi:S1-C subfamily serine protease